MGERAVEREEERQIEVDGEGERGTERFLRVKKTGKKGRRVRNENKEEVGEVYP